MRGKLLTIIRDTLLFRNKLLLPAVLTEYTEGPDLQEISGASTPAGDTGFYTVFL